MIGIVVLLGRSGFKTQLRDPSSLREIDAPQRTLNRSPPAQATAVIFNRTAARGCSPAHHLQSTADRTGIRRPTIWLALTVRTVLLKEADDPRPVAQQRVADRRLIMQVAPGRQAREYGVMGRIIGRDGALLGGPGRLFLAP
jgi:hypothetical protein